MISCELGTDMSFHNYSVDFMKSQINLGAAHYEAFFGPGL